MSDRECTAFLSWAIPEMRLSWRGYRNVRRQVCKRLAQRMAEVGVQSTAGYRDHLAAHPDEWQRLRRLCRVTISRFYRDGGVFRTLGAEVLPRLAELARRGGREQITVWSAGCAGGEEVYTVTLVWHLEAPLTVRGVRLRILGTDVDAEELERARLGRYPAGALRELPAEILSAGFDEEEVGVFRVRDRFRDGVDFRCSDLAEEMPDGPFDLILCRNLAFTYFDERLQGETAARFAARMTPGGALVVGRRETVPEVPGLAVLSASEGIYRRDR